jgi:polysaccharide export outer membrane protein
MLNRYGSFFFLLFIMVLASCVPNTRYVPLQYGDVNTKNLPLDTVVRVRTFSFKEYQIKPGDQLSVNVETLTPDEYNFVKQLNPMTNTGGGMMGGMGGMALMGYLVDKNGQIEFPVLGYVTLQGLTMLEAETRMKELLLPLLKDPVVRIRILNYRFIFAGELSGIVTSPTPRMSLLEAVNMAGGFTEFSDRQNIKIIRQKEDRAEIFYVNLLEEEFISSPNFWLEQNDIVIIRPLRQRATRQYLFQNIGFFLSLTTLAVSAASLLSR